MSDYDTKRATRYLPHVALATTAVVVMPVAVVWWLRSRGTITSVWAALVLAVGLSLLASVVGSAYWKRRRGPRDLLFGELLVWGWLRRVRMERQLGNAMELLRTEGELRGNGHKADEKFSILRQLAVALEAQDAYTDGHSRRVAAHAVIVARKMGLTSGNVSRLRAAAAIHDIGKVRVPPDVLDKPGRLTSAEFELVKRHADQGADIVAGLGDPELTAIVRHHHERFDGTGYPSGLAGERIPLGARIIAVADTFDAMTSVRPYRPAATHKQALDALVDASGNQLDPAVVRAFLRAYSGSRAIVFWSLLTVSPQQAVAWLRAKRPAPTNALLSWMAATVAAITTIAITAIGTSIGPRSGASQTRHPGANAPRAIVGAPSGSTIFGPRRSSHRLTASLRGSAAQASRQVASASRTAAPTPPPGSGSVGNGNTVGTHSGGGSGGGRVPGRAGALGGAPAGGSSGSSAGRPAPGSTGSSGPGSGGGSAHGAPRAGSGAGSGRGSSGGPGGARRGGSGGAPRGGSGGARGGGAGGARGGGSGAGSPTGSSGGSPGGSSGSAGGSASGSAGTPNPGSAGGSPGGSSGSSGASGSSSGTRAGGPSNKDQCKNGGYVQFGFSNQGQCIASVEPGSH